MGRAKHCLSSNMLVMFSSLIALLYICSLGGSEKICRFEQLIGSCRPRETYQLQHQLTIRHGQVYGFDLLDEFPSEISTLVLKNLSFSHLANCRLVSTSQFAKMLICYFYFFLWGLSNGVMFETSN